MISQKSDDENVYYYEDLCFEALKKRSDFDDEMEAALKERNDWNKPIDEDKLTCRRILAQFEKKFDDFEKSNPLNSTELGEMVISNFGDGEYEFIARELFDRDSFGRGLYFIRCVIKRGGGGLGVESYGPAYFMMIEPDGTYDESSFIIEVDAYNYWEDLMEFKELHNWNEP